MIRLTPIVRAAIAAAGTITGHGCTLRPIRFSPIIRPQSAAGGWSPSPTKLRAATSRIAVVSRSPKSTRSGLLNARQDLDRHHVGRPLAASTRRLDIREVDDLERRGAGDASDAGRRGDRDREDDEPEARPECREEQKRQDQRREREREIGAATDAARRPSRADRPRRGRGSSRAGSPSRSRSGPRRSPSGPRRGTC